MRWVVRGSGRRTRKRSSLAGKLRLYLTSVAFCLFLTPAFPADHGETIQLAAFEYPPFYYEEDGEVKGIGVVLLHDLFDRLDKRIEIRMYPIKRALDQLKHGTIDGIMFLIKTPEREEYLDYTNPIICVNGFFWYSKERMNKDFKMENFDILKNYNVGVTRGYSYGVEIDKIINSIPVDVANTDLSNFKKLLSGRIDLFPGNEIVAKGLFKLHPELKGRIDNAEEAFIKWILHMGISKQSQLAEMMLNINEALSEMEKEGIIDSTVKAYTE